MHPGQLIIRGAVLLGLVAAFLVVMNKVGDPQDYRRASSLETRPASTVTPAPSPTVMPTPTLNTMPPPSHKLVCANADPSPLLTEVDIRGSRGGVIARVYCDGPDLRYVTYVDQYGIVERTYLFEDGQVRVKIYYVDGWVVRRVDFDREGNLVPDGTYIKLPSSRIGPGL